MNKELNIEADVSRYTCGLDIAKDKDYTVTRYYADGQLIKEEIKEAK